MTKAELEKQNKKLRILLREAHATLEYLGPDSFDDDEHSKAWSKYLAKLHAASK